MKFPSDEEIRIFKDGDSWCATRRSFINLQESLAGFGDNEIDAISQLFAAEMQTEIDRRKVVRNWYCNACKHPFSFKTGHDRAPCPRCKGGNQYTYEVSNTKFPICEFCGQQTGGPFICCEKGAL